MTCFRIVGDLRRSLTAARPVLFPELLHLSRGGQLGQASVLGQVRYNDEHLHSGITFTSPLDRHDGRDASILDERRSVYAAAKGRHPERWGSRDTRAWKRVQRVHLNPAYETLLKLREDQAA